MEQSNTLEDIRSSAVSYDNRSAPGGNSAFDTIKVKVAQGLKSAAATLRPKSLQSGEPSEFAGQTARWLDNAGGYVEDLSVSKVKTDIQRQMRTNPGRSLLIAGAVGLVVGSLFRRR
jgi:ElaB/YqjD/DUF883 family membrane-anchored ribosome-binding protein